MPFISEETRQRLLEDLGLQTPPTTARVLEGITGEKQPNPADLINNTTETVFIDMVDVNRPLAEKIDQFTAGYGGIYGQARIEGMALVLRAYDLQLEHDLIGRLANLDTNELMEADGILGLRTIGSTTLHKLLISPRIPEQQAALNYVVNAASRYAPPSSEFIIGAAQMYMLLSIWWPKLFPNQTSSQPPTADLA